MLWKKLLDATEISDIQSDRICGIRVKKSSVDDTSITILGVYLPCLDLGIDLFRDCLAELERVISESECMGPVIVAGDFNAHLGSMWGPRAGGNPNLQGVLLGDLLNRCKLHAVSLSESVSGPSYTYKSGNTVTTVDYILADIEASSCIDSCKVCSDDDLNTSDHLALSVTLSCHIPTQFTSDPNWNRIDWTEAAKSQALQAFQKEVAIRLKPFTGQARGNVDHIDNEIKHVAWLILDAAQKTLPQLKPKKTKRFKDRTLSQLCTKSKEAWNVWCTNGKPSNGPLYEVKCAMRREVRKRIKLCTAMEGRRQIQKREHLFRKNYHLRFQRPQKRGKSRCTRLRVNDVLLSEPAQLLEAWSTHFRTLAESQINSEPGLKEMQRQQVSLLSCTFQMEETFLDTSFTEIEVAHAVQRMKLRKSAGPDDLVAEHLHYGGRSVIIWLTEILNSILDVACITLDWRSLHSVCTIRKLRFLHRVVTNEESICYRAFSAMVDDVEALSLVRECRELEGKYKSDFTSQILSASDPTTGLCVLKEAEDHIQKEDKALQLKKTSKFNHLTTIAELVGWRKLWDSALDHGPSCVKSLKNLVRIISYPDHATSECPKCDVAVLDLPSLPEHIIDGHTNSDSSWDTLINSLVRMDPSFFSHVLCLINVF